MTESRDSSVRSIEMARVATGRYTARNAAGAQLEFGQGEGVLSPVELLLAALAGCTAIDVDTAVSRSAEPTEFRILATGHKVVEEGAHRLDDLNLSISISFSDDAGGRKAASMVERLVALSHDKYCTVSRTVEHGTPVSNDVSVRVEGTAHNDG